MEVDFTIIMCFPGFHMQGLDHMYLLLYPSLQCLQVNKSLCLYVERISAIFLKMQAVLEERWTILTNIISTRANRMDNLQSRKLRTSLAL
jgi:hypothetical protein